MNRFQRIAITAFVCLEVLIFAGAIVRVTGSGLGIPDWPKCYGHYLPPSSAADIDFTRLDLAKFKAAAQRHRRDPDTITIESLRAGFDPVATWIEYLNRLTSLPLGIAVLAMLVASFRQRPRVVLVASITATILLVLNAWIGGTVVLSALQPLRITLHVLLALLMQGVIIFAAWRAADRPWCIPRANPKLIRIAGILAVLVVIEGLMGTQIRQLTDHLLQTAKGERATWIGTLEQSGLYLVHRSFSWLVLGAAVWFGRLAKQGTGQLGWLERSIVILVLAQMCLGVVLSQVGILATAQILHIALSSLLVSALFLWLLAAAATPEHP